MVRGCQDDQMTRCCWWIKADLCEQFTQLVQLSQFLQLISTHTAHATYPNSSQLKPFQWSQMISHNSSHLTQLNAAYATCTHVPKCPCSDSMYIFIQNWNNHHPDDLHFQGFVGVVRLNLVKSTRKHLTQNHLQDGFVNSLRECFPFRAAAATWKWFAGCEVCEFIEAGGIFSIQSFTLVRDIVAKCQIWYSNWTKLTANYILENK